MLRALDCSLCPFVRVPHIEQRPVFARARKAALDFLGPDHRDRLHRLALRSSGDNTDISACDTVERDSYEMRHGSFELVFRSEEHTSELQSLMRISYAVFCLKKKNKIHPPRPLNHL